MGNNSTLIVHYVTGQTAIYDDAYKFMINENKIYVSDKDNDISRIINFDNVTSISFKEEKKEMIKDAK